LDDVFSVHPLPIDPFVDLIRAHARSRRAVVVTAAPGAGKTTRVPPVLAEDGPTLLLQPRRVAARAIARRIAEERGWTVGREVGWHVRFERRFVADTRLIVATEGVLTARLQQDPLLSEFRTVVLDEFHERSIHADLGLALAKQAAQARDDLRIVVMSATLDAARVAAFLDDCPVVDVPGRAHPVEMTWRPGSDLASTVASNAVMNEGAILCFLPGAPEIRRAVDAIRSHVRAGVDVLPLHGGLDADEEDRAIAPSNTPRIIVATNIAETTLTVPDVRLVVDSGLHKVARYDAARGVDSLETERISQDSADQRAGRAGRTGPGRTIRLWDARDRLRPHREPEIARIDLASVALDILAWGGDPRTFAWFDPPPATAIDGAMALLGQLGAVDAHGALTVLGRELHRFPLHPRLARLLVAAGGAEAAARACALLSERHFALARGTATTSDLLSAVDDPRALPPHVTAIARDIRRLAREVLGPRLTDTTDERRFRAAVLAGYPDRVGRRRAAGTDRVLLSSGAGARIAHESGVYDAEFLVAIDVTEPAKVMAGNSGDALIRMASAVEKDWLTATHADTDHRFDVATGRVIATRTERYGALPLHEASVAVDPSIAANALVSAYVERGPTESDRQLQHRLVCAGIEVVFEDIIRAAAAFASSLAAIDPAAHLDPSVRARLTRDAPETLPLPSGRSARLDYREDGRILAAVKLQELFGLADTPRIGQRRVPVTFELLAPNGRPVQVTADLRSFWTTGYPEVRKQLRARYPRHPWPEDPWTATPTHRTKRR